jgi:hypothetical protein
MQAVETRQKLIFYEIVYRKRPEDGEIGSTLAIDY